MPASSRAALLFDGDPLDDYGLLPGDSGVGGWPGIVANGLWGGYLTAVTDVANARVRVDLYWPGISLAQVYRVHADGTEHLVRGGDPATMCTAWARWDYECPLDTAVTYKAVSEERTGSVATTAAVTLTPNTQGWLKHPNKPNLNRQVTIRALDSRRRESRRGVLRPPLRKYPVVVHGARSGHIGQIVLATSGTAELDAINLMLDDGAELLLQLPSAWGGHSWYISIATNSEDRLDPVFGSLLKEHVALSFETTDRAVGSALGGATDKYTDVAARYPTYNHIEASGLTYTELSMLT